MPDAPLDEAAFGELLVTVGGDRTFLAELVQTYLADSPALFDSMRAGLLAEDRVVLRRAAHTLKSTSASLGALPLAALCREIELAAPDGDAAWLQARIEAAVAAYALADDALRGQVEGPPRP